MNTNKVELSTLNKSSAHRQWQSVLKESTNSIIMKIISMIKMYRSPLKAGVPWWLFCFKDKAAPLGVKWGNDWMQAAAGYINNFSEYAQGKTTSGKISAYGIVIWD